jgi:hypothetical protein
MTLNVRSWNRAINLQAAALGRNLQARVLHNEGPLLESKKWPWNDRVGAVRAVGRRSGSAREQ